MKLLTLLSLITILPLSGYATPVKFANCNTSVKLKSPKNASGVYFNDNCDTAYVLPPETGSFQISGLLPTGNLQLVCQAYNDIEQTIANTISSLKMSSARIESFSKKAQDYMDNLEDGLVPVGMTAEEVDEKIDELLTKSTSYQAQFIKSFNDLKSLKAYYAKTEGAVGKFLLESDYVKLVEEYQKKNPSIHFVRIPIEQSYIMINEKTKSETEDPLDFPMEAVMSLSSPTADFIPLLKQIRDPQPTDVPPAKTPGGIFTDGLSGNIQLSALGACPLLDKSGLPESINMGDLDTYISANVVYQYHVQVLRKHSISYNLGQLAKRIESSSEKGGFFSRKKVHSLTEESKSEKWIKFEMYSDDPTYNYTESYRQEIKEQFLNSVLQEVAYVSFDNPGNYPSVALPTGASGASVASDALGKCPHPYCQVGMYAMKFLDATFGSKSAISEFIRNRDIWAQETVEERAMVPYVGSYTFK